MSQGSYRGPDRRRGFRQADLKLLLATLDEVDHGLIVVRPDFSVLVVNDAGRRALAVDEALQIVAGHLCCVHPTDQRELGNALDAAANRQMRSLIHVGVAGSRQPLSVTPLSVAGDATNAHVCLLKLPRTDLAPELSVMAFARLHGLSVREREVLAELCRGRRPAEIGQMLGLSLATVRSHIIHLRAKAGVPDVLTLVKRVASVPSVELAIKVSARDQAQAGTRPPVDK